MGNRILNQRELDPATQFKRKLIERFFVRFHMTLALAGVCVSGLLISKLLLELGVRSMLERYLVAVCISYLVFFALIRTWLWYITPSSKRQPTLPDIDIGDAVDLGRVSVNAIRGGASGGTVNALFGGGGGDFGCGGATDLWGDAPNASESAQSSASSVLGGHRSSSGSSGGGLD